jgi:nucleoside-diphosphate-sugar epimerase
VSVVLVTGGNGFVGRHVVDALQRRGDEVRALALPGEDAPLLEERCVEIYRGDIRDPESLVAPMRGADSVLHLAAMMDVWRPMAAYYGANVSGTENVCRAALAAGVGRLVHMSSSSVYGVGLGKPADERFPLIPFADAYPLTKAAGDRLVYRMMLNDCLPAVIVRADQVFGPGDTRRFARLADRLRSGTGVIVGDGDNALPLVYVSDVVDGLLLALDDKRAVGQAYNITNDAPLTQKQFLHTIAREVGAQPPRVHAPFGALYAAGWLAERAASVASSWRRPSITRLGVALAGTDNRYGIAKARRELGYKPRVTLEDGVRRTARWYLQGVCV